MVVLEGLVSNTAKSSSKVRFAVVDWYNDSEITHLSTFSISLFARVSLISFFGIAITLQSTPSVKPLVTAHR